MRIRTECSTWLTKLMYLAILAAGLFVVASFPAAAKNPATEQEPVYNPATTIDFFATVTEVREVPVGTPLAGLHVVVKAKGSSFDVYVAPADFAQKYRITLMKGHEI